MSTSLSVPPSCVREFPRGNSDGETELDAALASLRLYREQADTSLWDIGALLNRIFTDGLWEHRRNEHGEPRYASFKDFIESETNLQYTHAVKLTHLAPLGREAFAQHGLRRLYAVASAPEAAQTVLLAACDGGATAVEIERLARAARAANPDSPRGPGRPPKEVSSPPSAFVEPETVEATPMGDGRFNALVMLDGCRAFWLTFTPPTEGVTVGTFAFEWEPEEGSS